MPHTDANKSQATNRLSCHASTHTSKSQITGNKSCILPCLTQIPANERQQIVQLPMLNTDTSKTQATNRASCHASHRYQSSRGNKAKILHASHRYQQITGNKSCILPCLTHRPAKHKQQIVLASQIYQQISTTNQAPVNHGQHIVHVALPHTCTSKSPTTNRSSYHASYR